MRDHAGRLLKSAAFVALALIALAWLLGCGYAPPQASDGAYTRDDVSGVVAGLVLTEPVSLEEARALGRELGGDLISLYRTDYVMVRTTVNGTTDIRGGTGTEPSRFTYVDAGNIRSRRLASMRAGKSPPITGMHINEGYWLHYEDQWAKAQEPGVKFEAMGLYVPKSALDTLRADPRFGAVAIIKHYRTDSLSSDYPGDLLLEEELFPSGLLTEPTMSDEDAIERVREYFAARGAGYLGGLAVQDVRVTDESKGRTLFITFVKSPGQFYDAFSDLYSWSTGENGWTADLNRIGLGLAWVQMVFDYADRSSPERLEVDVAGRSVAGSTRLRPGDWATLVSVSGSGDGRSQTFTLTGAPALMRFDLIATAPVTATTAFVTGELTDFGVNLVKKGAEPPKDGFDVLPLTEGNLAPLSDWPPGTYYLDVRSHGFQWTVTIEEER